MPDYRVKIDTSDGRHRERTIYHQSGPAAAYKAALSDIGHDVSSIRHVEIDRIDPPKQYTIKLTEEERQHFLTYWGHGQYHANLSNSIHSKVETAQPD